ncbi:hypothetical protein F5884DRAFT_68665 [Xylogone sp. PMI_703]|nr:hypothetical protein F5884DRAFT_68665 [Xylogone sp. PMI_703]
MPSNSHSPNAPAPRIPAWKRLGMELKKPESKTSEQTRSSPAMHDQESSPRHKRKKVLPEEKASSKKIKSLDQKESSASDTTPAPITPHLKRQKSVTFTPETKTEDGDSIKQLFNNWVAEQKAQDLLFSAEFEPSSDAESLAAEGDIDETQSESDRRTKRVKRSVAGGERNTKISTDVGQLKPSGSKQTNLPPRPFLAYLQHYHTSRETWKFNKNHQNHLLKHLFNVDTIPSEYAPLLYPYVRGLQGAVRTRLRDAAIAIKIQDQEEGAGGFSEAITDPASKQEEYEKVMTDHRANMAREGVSTAAGYEEGVIQRLSDSIMVNRVVKRMRAEQVLVELGAPETPPDEAKVTAMTYPDSIEDADGQKRVRMNDGTAQKVGRKRKLRTQATDDSSSSEESSDSSDSSSSEESTSESDSDSSNSSEDTTSSSSSSSSSESDSDSDSSNSNMEDTSEESDSD